MLTSFPDRTAKRKQLAEELVGSRRQRRTKYCCFLWSSFLYVLPQPIAVMRKPIAFKIKTTKFSVQSERHKNFPGNFSYLVASLRRFTYIFAANCILQSLLFTFIVAESGNLLARPSNLNNWAAQQRTWLALHYSLHVFNRVQQWERRKTRKEKKRETIPVSRTLN